MTVGDIEELLVASDGDLSDDLRQLVDWHFERAMTTAKLWFGLAALLLAAVLAAAFGAHTGGTGISVWFARRPVSPTGKRLHACGF